MKSLRNRLAISVVISAFAAGAVAAHAQSAGVELRQDENSPQLSMGPVQDSLPLDHEGSAAVVVAAQAESSPIGIFHRADSSPVRAVSTAMRAIAKRRAVIASPFDDPINTASPGG
jgi:hypothetical protein